MKDYQKTFPTLLLLCFIVITFFQGIKVAYSQTSIAPREKFSLDLGWRFHMGAVEGYTTNIFKGGGDGGNPASISYDDSHWRGINLPHDFMIETPIDSTASAVNGSFANGIAWYRREFKVSSVDKGKRFILSFDGISRYSHVYVNGFQVKFEPSGYIGFSVDITEALKYDSKNVIAVRVNTKKGAEGWWYEGGGIYRHVWLEKKAPVHIPSYGVAIDPELSSNFKSANLKIRIEVKSDNYKESNVTPEIVLTDAEGHEVKKIKGSSELITPGETKLVNLTMPVKKPKLWSPENPTLYKVKTRLIQGKKVIDGVRDEIGFRKFVFDTTNGFSVNGKKEIIKGVCLHQDHSGVGIAVPEALWRYRLKKLKGIGVNAVRLHHPMGPEFVKMCNEMGILYLAETRHFSAFGDEISMFERMVKMDRNAPSVIAWSLGNEENIQGQPMAARIVDKMRRRKNILDLQKRPVTMPFNGSTNGPAAHEVDVVGYNYGTDKIYGENTHNNPIFSSESASMVNTRGEYKTDTTKNVSSAYDRKAVGWGQSAEEVMDFTMNLKKLGGTFVWTGFDYRGEPTPFGYPNVSSDFGLFDLCGFRKDISYFFEAWWSKHDVLHIMPHWNWQGHENEPIDVWVYSNYDQVELLLNGRSLGKKDMPKYKHLAWKVPYKKGTLTAKGYRNGKEVATSVVKTAGPPAKILIDANRSKIIAAQQDVIVFNISIVDAKGNFCPNAGNLLHFKIKGAGNILGVGNGNPGSHESDKIPIRRAFHGKAQVIVQASGETGNVNLKVTSKDLDTKSITINSVVPTSSYKYLPSPVKDIDVMKFYPEKLLNTKNASSKKAWNLEEMYKETAGYKIKKAGKNKGK